MQAYQGQAAFIKSQAVFKAAMSIHPSRPATPHGSATSRGMSPAPAAFNPALTKYQVLAAVGATGFIKG